MTAEIVAEYDVVLCVGDTTFLDYDRIVVKREGYGPIGKGGNGLILHSALALEATNGQSIGLLWQKLWNREPKPKPPSNETPAQKKKRQAAARKASRNRPFEERESYRWRVEEYHKILKSGCQVERYRLAADGMKDMLRI